MIVAVAASLVSAWRSERDMLRRVVRESTPILFAAACQHDGRDRHREADTYGIPLETSSVDFVGALALILVIVSLGST